MWGLPPLHPEKGDRSRMCGIVVVPLDQPVVYAKAFGEVKSRGPDSFDQIVVDGMFFGFRRLEIVRPEDGKQPYEDDEVVVLFNGELYNWDRSFPSEVAWLAMLARSCRDFPRLLQGQFFVVVYYKKLKEFMYFRDPLGIVPGYETRWYPDKLGLCSEPVGHQNYMWNEISPGVVYWRPASALSPRRPYAEVYWKPSLGMKSKFNVNRLEEELSSTVDVIRGHADVPVSFALGGMDSMIALTLLCEVGNEPDEIFTVGFKSGGDDLDFAGRFMDWLSRQMKMKFDWKVSLVDDKEAKETLMPQLSERLGEDLTMNPVKAWGALRAALVAREAIHKVILCGDGADELFYGYPYFDKYEEPHLTFKGLQALQSMHRINLDRTDRAGMLFSKEYRPLYLERNFVEWVLKHKRQKNKADLRALGRRLGIPDEFLNRPKWGPDDVRGKEIATA
jgi:asparagine synthetase B (glutamine-hydrolysing)